MNQIQSWNFAIIRGYNKLIISQPLFVKKGYMIYLAQNIDSGKVAVDQSGKALYSDIAWKSYLEKLSPYNNSRFYLQQITNFTSYQSSISLYYRYSTTGLYKISLRSLSSNQHFETIFNITDCKCFLFQLIFIILFYF